MLCTILGSTPLGMYKKLIEYHKAGLVSFEYVKTFNMDEYVGLCATHEQSYHYFMWENLFKHIDIDPKNVNILDGMASDLEKQCTDFEQKINEAGGIDLFIGGKVFLFICFERIFVKKRLVYYMRYRKNKL